MTGREDRAGPRRLLFVTGSAHPLGGLNTWLDYLLPGLAERGWEPVLGLVEGPRHHRPERQLAAHPHDPWVRIPCRTGTPEGRCRALVRALSVVAPDVAVGVNVPDLYPAVNRARRAGSPVRTIMTVHAIEPELYGDAFRFHAILDGAAATNRLACRLLEAVSGYAGERVFYAPYGWDPATSVPPARAENDQFAVGYAGRLEEPQKRVLDLPRVAAALDELGVRAGWRVAGSGPAERALRAGLPEGRTELLGAVPAAELPERLYRTVDALLVPSRWETGPLVAWEAMAEGVPVVAARYVGSGLEAALVHEETALLFDVGDVAEASRLLGRLAREPALRERLVVGGLRLLRERFSRARSIEAWERAVESVLARPPRPPGPDPDVPPATGRLDRWLGPGPAERIRQAVGRAGPESGSGGEWPHAYSRGGDREEFLRMAGTLDRSAEAGACSPR